MREVKCIRTVPLARGGQWETPMSRVCNEELLFMDDDTIWLRRYVLESDRDGKGLQIDQVIEKEALFLLRGRNGA